MKEQSCTFFGHRDCPDEVKGRLRKAVEAMIAQGVTHFYVGKEGRFDAAVRMVLRDIQKKYPHIRYEIVLAYLPQGEQSQTDTNTLFPEKLATVPRRFAISRRNEWMLQQSEFVVTYVTYSWGNAARWEQQARKQGKTVVALASIL